MSWFEAETAVERVTDVRWSAHVSGHWNIGTNPNGGYLAAIALRALRQLGPHTDPISVTTHFLRPGTAGAAAEVITEVLRVGRTITTARATLVQDGRARLEMIASLADLASPSGIEDALTIAAPPIPPPDQCVLRSGVEQGIDLPILDRVDIMLDGEQATAGQAGAAEVSGWIRLGDGAPPDALALVLFADAFPPSLFGLLGNVGWVPSVELTVHVRRRPAAGWILGQFSTSDLHDGRMIEDGALWDESGALVAQMRQIGLLLSRADASGG
ncbi:MAG: thioesterase family protein [Ilumatobacter sp.]|nr:thioesterase family protein [Ilumatobacter sp.]